MSEPNEHEDSADKDPADLLAQAREKSALLLKRLIAEAAQIDRNPPKISAPALAEGRAAMANAIAAAQRTIAANDAALNTSETPGD